MNDSQKVRKQQSLSVFCSPGSWATDPLHSLAAQLVADPYNASDRLFSHIGEVSVESRVAAYINRLLKSVYEHESSRSLTQNLQSQSSRRGGAAFASSHSDVNLSDLAHRGMWTMDGFATLLEYISPTSSSDQTIAKVLGGWKETSEAAAAPSLKCFDAEPHDVARDVHLFASRLRQVHFSKIGKQSFCDCLTASLLMYYADTTAVIHDHIVHAELRKVAASVMEISQDDTRHTLSLDGVLLSWGSKIKTRFVRDNMMSLPLDYMYSNLSEKELCERYVGVHTFAETLERLLLGYRQISAQQEEIKVMLRSALLLWRNQEPAPVIPAVTDVPERHQAKQQTKSLNSALQHKTARNWPSNLKSLKGRSISDILVQYFADKLSLIPIATSNRAQKEVMTAMKIVGQFVAFETIREPDEATSEADKTNWMKSLQSIARQAEAKLLQVVNASKLNETKRSKRKRNFTNSVAGIVRAWSGMTDAEKRIVSRGPKLRM